MFELKLTTDRTYEVSNYDALVKQLSEEVEKYKVNEINEDTYKVAKANKSKLNNLIKEVNDTRIAAEKVYMQPFNVGKAQCDNLIAIAKSVSDELDKGIKKIDDAIKSEKYNEIEKYFNSVNNLPIDLKSILGSKWLNKTAKMDDIKEEIDSRLKSIKYDISQIKEVATDNTLLVLVFDYLENGMDIEKTFTKYEKFLTMQEALKQAI